MGGIRIASWNMAGSLDGSASADFRGAVRLRKEKSGIPRKIDTENSHQIRELQKSGLFRESSKIASMKPHIICLQEVFGEAASLKEMFPEYEIISKSQSGDEVILMRKNSGKSVEEVKKGQRVKVNIDGFTVEVVNQHVGGFDIEAEGDYQKVAEQMRGNLRDKSDNELDDVDLVIHAGDFNVGSSPDGSRVNSIFEQGQITIDDVILHEDKENQQPTAVSPVTGIAYQLDHIYAGALKDDTSVSVKRLAYEYDIGGDEDFGKSTKAQFSEGKFRFNPLKVASDHAPVVVDVEVQRKRMFSSGESLVSKENSHLSAVREKFTSNEVGKIQTREIRGLRDRISLIPPSDITKLTTSQIGKLTPKQILSLQPVQIQALSQAELTKGKKADYLNFSSFKREEILKLSEEQIKALSPGALKKLIQASVKADIGYKGFYLRFSLPSMFSKYFTNRTYATAHVMLMMTPDQRKEQKRYLPFPKSDSYHMKLLNTHISEGGLFAHISDLANQRKLREDQLRMLGERQIGLFLVRHSHLVPTHFMRSIPPLAFKNDPELIDKLNPIQLMGLNLAQVNSILDTTSNLRPKAIFWSGAMANKIAIDRGYVPKGYQAEIQMAKQKDQIETLRKKEFSAQLELFPSLESTLIHDYVKNMPIEDIKFLTPKQIVQFKKEWIKNWSEEQIAAFPKEYMKDLPQSVLDEMVNDNTLRDAWLLPLPKVHMGTVAEKVSTDKFITLAKDGRFQRKLQDIKVDSLMKIVGKTTNELKGLELDSLEALFANKPFDADQRALIKSKLEPEQIGHLASKDNAWVEKL